MAAYELRQIDGYLYDNEDWVWNESYHIGTYDAKGNDHKQAFLRALKKYGVACIRGTCVVTYDGDIYELQTRKTKEPLFAAIPIES